MVISLVTCLADFRMSLSLYGWGCPSTDCLCTVERFFSDLIQLSSAGKKHFAGSVRNIPLRRRNDLAAGAFRA
jgi:hypothetical protein